jgi:hypothetical protein
VRQLGILVAGVLQFAKKVLSSAILREAKSLSRFETAAYDKLVAQDRQSERHHFEFFRKWFSG